MTSVFGLQVAEAEKNVGRVRIRIHNDDLDTVVVHAWVELSRSAETVHGSCREKRRRFISCLDACLFTPAWDDDIKSGDVILPAIFFINLLMGD